MAEVWKDIAGFEGLYKISSLGRVVSVARLGNRGGGVIKPTANHAGYLRVGLHKNNKRQMYRVHRLVAEAFLPNPDKKPQINHKNGVKADNRANNLEWVTVSENLRHSYNKLKRTKSTLGRFGAKNPSSKPVAQIKSGSIVATFSAAKEAERKTGIHQGNISKCARGNTRSAGGFQWEYIKQENKGK